MKDFAQDPRWQFQLRMRPIADNLYYRTIPNLASIERFDKVDERHILDREFAIDLKFIFKDAQIITAQEKFRQFSSKYCDVTVEYYNDPIDMIKGDWFNLCAQLYFCGFASQDEKKFEHWILLDWLRVVWETQKGNICWVKQQNPVSNADFLCAPMATIPPNCIIDCRI